MKLFVVCLFVVSCGDYNFNTEYGMTVFPAAEMNLTPEVVNSSTSQWIDAAVQESVGIFDWTENQLAGVINHSTMTVQPSPLRCYFKKSDGTIVTQCDGLFWADLHRIALGYKPDQVTFCQSAFWDELTHMAFESEGIYYSGYREHEIPEINALFIAIKKHTCYDIVGNPN